MKLRISQPDSDPLEVEVDADEITVGRAHDCDVVVSSPYASKKHFRLLRGLVACDLGSSNGTFTSEGRLEGATLVRDGKLSIGPDDVRIEILEEEDPLLAEAGTEVKALKARVAGLEHELQQGKDENDFLRLRLESLEKANAKRAAIEAMSKAHLEREGKDFHELHRLQAEYGQLLERLNAEIDARMKKAAPYGSSR